MQLEVARASQVRCPRRFCELAVVVLTIGFGGIVAGGLGLAAATVGVVAVGVGRHGIVGGATALMVFSGSVSVAHYGFGSHEWTESEDRTWVLFTSLAVVAALSIAAWGRDKAVRSLPLAVAAAVVTALLVDESLGIRATSAAVMAAIVMFALFAFTGVYRDLRPSRSLVRLTLDLTLAVGVTLDLAHDVIGGFGGRGPPRFGVERWIGTTLDPNEFGELGLLALGLTLLLASRDKHPWRPTVVARMMIYGLLIVMSGSRTSIGLAVLVLVIAALAAAGPRLQMAGLAALTLLAVGVTLSWSSVESGLNRQQDVEGVSALNGRTDIWDLAMEERLDNPVMALGFGGSEQHFRELHATTRPIPWENISTHNRLLEAWVALGFHAALILLAIWIVSMKRAFATGPLVVAVVGVTIVSSMMLPGFGSLRPGAWILVPLVLAVSSSEHTDGSRLP